MRRFHYAQGLKAIKEAVMPRTAPFAAKLAWFLAHGYEAHLYQLAFHTMCDEADKILAHRFLVAGRRGGKTLSAAWETACYCLNPAIFHWDVHKTQSDRPLHVWILVPNFATAGRAAKRTFEGVLRQCGLSQGKGYHWNKGENTVEFDNLSFVEFKTAEQADNLVGAGIDILWIDEFCVIPTGEAYEYASPALDDKLGIVYATSTPRGKNWGYDLGWSPEAQADVTIGSVEYRSIDNPFFSKDRWLYRKARVHPNTFKREYEAAFDSNAGKELHGDWLHTYDVDELPLKDSALGVQNPDGSLRIDNLDLNIYLGVDPAISLADTADHFALVVLGVAKNNSGAWLLETYRDRIAFPDQVQLIQDYHLKWRPLFIGVEAQAFQAALVQQLQRLKSMPPVVPQMARGQKSDRILGMSPSFRLGRVKIRPEFVEFIDEWLDFDTELKSCKDDLLDATEIALRTAGIILPLREPEVEKHKTGSIEELAWMLQPKPLQKDGEGGHIPYDDTMGSEW